MTTSKKAAKSQTDWPRVKREAARNAPIPYSRSDGPYNPNRDSEVEAYWSNAQVSRKGRGPQKSPTKESITIRLSADVVGYFRASGKGWQSRVDDVLSEWVASHAER